MTEGVLFDPGFGQYLTMFSANVEYMYQNLNKIKNFNQKKFQFKVFYAQLIKLLNNHIAFYFGCMLWAAYIKSLENQKILEHPCLGEVYDEKIAVFEVNYIKEFIEKFKKDSKYYLSIDFEMEDYKLKILEFYEKFIVENESFVKIEFTNDIKIPNKFLQLQNFEEINLKIQSVIHTGALEELFAFYDKI